MPRIKNEPTQEGLKSINILLTPHMRKTMSRNGRGNRSEGIRRALGIILAAELAGEDVAASVREHARQTSPKKRRDQEDAGYTWIKAIVWVPKTTISKVNKVRGKVSISDFVRGAVIFAAGGIGEINEELDA